MSLYKRFTIALKNFDIEEMIDCVNLGFDVDMIVPEIKTTILNNLVINHDIERIKVLIYLGADINKTGESGMCPFTWAIYHKYIDIIDLLIDNGVDYTVPYAEDVELMDYLVLSGDKKIAKHILEKIYPIGYKSLNNDMNVYEIFPYESPTTEKFLLDYDKKQLEWLKLAQEKPAMYDPECKLYSEKNEFLEFCKNNNIEMVKKYIAAKNDINVKDKYGYTGLMWSAEKKNYEITKILLDNGADINTISKTSWGGTVLNILIHEKNNSKEIELIDKLLEEGFDVNHGQPLFTAVGADNLPITRKLLELGANINDKYKYMSKDPLLFYCKSNKILKELIKYHVNVNSHDSDKFTALMLNINTNNIDSVKTLIKAGANLDIQTITGENALMLACIHNNVEAVKILINNNVNLMLRDNEGKTALMYAVENECDEEIFDLLLLNDNGKALFNAKDNQGNCAIDIASNLNLYDIEELLEQYQ